MLAPKSLLPWRRIHSSELGWNHSSLRFGIVFLSKIIENHGTRSIDLSGATFFNPNPPIEMTSWKFDQKWVSKLIFSRKALRGGASVSHQAFISLDSTDGITLSLKFEFAFQLINILLQFEPVCWRCTAERCVIFYQRFQIFIV